MNVPNEPAPVAWDTDFAPETANHFTPLGVMRSATPKEKWVHDCFELGIMKRRAVAPATLDPTSVFESMCQRFRVALHPLYVHGVSLYDESGVLLWLTASFGPTEDEAVRKAYDKFADGSGSAVFAYDLGGARSAVLFRVNSATGQMLGAAMVVVDSGVLREYGHRPARLLTEKVRLAMRYLARGRQTSATRKPMPKSSSHTAPPFLTSLASNVSKSAPASNQSIAIRSRSVQGSVVRSAEASPGEPAREKGLHPARTLRRLTAGRKSSESRSDNSRNPDGIAPGSLHPTHKPKPLARRPALALVVQRLVSLREGAQPVRCEVLWALPSRTRRMGKNAADATPARQIRMHSKMERRALIELCRWVRQQPAGWRETMPFMWLKYSIGALLDRTFVHFVEQCLTRSGLPNDRLGFEIPAQDAAARADDLTKVATSIMHLRCFIVIDNFTLQSDHLDLLGLPAVRMVKLAPEIATAMRTDTWLQKRVACAAQTTRALGIKMIVKRTPSRSEALWYRDFGVEFAQSQPLSPGEPIGVLKDIDP